MPVLVFPSGLPLPHGSFQLLRALHSLLRSFPASATHLTMNLPVFFSVSSKSSSQQDMCIYPLIPDCVSVLLQAHSPVCAGTSKSQSDALHWFCLQRPWGYLLSLGILFFFYCGRKWAYINKEVWKNIWDSRLPNRDISYPISTVLPLETHP